MENKDINSKILNLWKNKKFSKYTGKHLPILYPEFKKGGILFIGLNPSFNETTFKNVIKGTKYSEVDIKEKLNIKNINNAECDCRFLIFLEGKANEKGKSPYFNKFHEISEHVGVCFQHIDLFYFRETKQKKAKERIIKKHEKKEILNDFALKQLKIAVEIISKIEPKIIVVANAFASDIITQYSKLFNLNEKNFDKNCYDTIKIKNKEVPILFTSMLTGQRALDKYSLQRLKCQINNIIHHNYI